MKRLGLVSVLLLACRSVPLTEAPTTPAGANEASSIVVDGLVAPHALRVVETRMLWMTDHLIQSADLDGKNVRTVADLAPRRPNRFAVEPRQIVWTSTLDRADLIETARSDGAERTTLVTLTGRVDALALHEGSVFYATQEPFGSAIFAIHRGDPSPRELAGPKLGPGHDAGFGVLGLKPAGADLLWNKTGSGIAGLRPNRIGDPPETRLFVSDREVGAFTISDDKLYIATRSGGLLRAPLAGGPSEELAPKESLEGVAELVVGKSGVFMTTAPFERRENGVVVRRRGASIARHSFSTKTTEILHELPLGAGDTHAERATKAGHIHGFVLVGDDLLFIETSSPDRGAIRRLRVVDR